MTLSVSLMHTHTHIHTQTEKNTKTHLLKHLLSILVLHFKLLLSEGMGVVPYNLMSLSMSVSMHPHACLCVHINGLRRLTAGVYSRRRANMRGQPTPYSTLLTCETCVSKCNSRDDITLRKCNEN